MQIFADHRGMKAVPQPAMTMRSMSRNSFGGHVEAAELGGGFLEGKAAAHGVMDGFRLLEDFLEHVMRDTRPCPRPPR